MAEFFHAEPSRRVLVIGGGAAGMLAALMAARSGAAVLLLERNEKLGKKVYITGKGRCNVTNLCDRDEFLSNVPRNPRFLYSALDDFGPEQMIALLEEMGCPTKVERGRRVFPVSEHASDVTRALEKGLRQANVAIRYGARVAALLTENETMTGVRLESGELIQAARVIAATGGLSYPATGSTGDGLRMAAEIGHTIAPTSPSLTGLETEEKWPAELQGLSLKNVALSCKIKGKTVFDRQGEMLFTHYGISGPLVLELSAHIPPTGTYPVALDLKPALTQEQVRERVKRDLAEAGKKQLSTILQGLLPSRMAALFPVLLGTDERQLCCQVTAQTREALVNALKALPLTVTGLRDYDEAIITRGGVSVREVNPATMASRKIAGLYFAGEMLDVDAHTGGYNLQIAFSTGALAGKSAAESLNT